MWIQPLYICSWFGSRPSGIHGTQFLSFQLWAGLYVRSCAWSFLKLFGAIGAACDCSEGRTSSRLAIDIEVVLSSVSYICSAFRSEPWLTVLFLPEFFFLVYKTLHSRKDSIRDKGSSFWSSMLEDVWKGRFHHGIAKHPSMERYINLWLRFSIDLDTDKGMVCLASWR